MMFSECFLFAPESLVNLTVTRDCLVTKCHLQINFYSFTVGIKIKIMSIVIHFNYTCKSETVLIILVNSYLFLGFFIDMWHYQENIFL